MLSIIPVGALLLLLLLLNPFIRAAALLDEARQFMAELSTGFISDGKREKLIGIILAKAVIEHFGGTLEAGTGDTPGFLVRFPTAA
jgi:hypothetical protein